MRLTRALTTTALSAGVLALSAIIAPAATADDDHSENRSGGATTVVLNPDLLPVLVEQLKVAPIPPGQLSAPGGKAQVSFPITEIEGKEIEHTGGLQFSPIGGGSLQISEFEVDLGTGYLSAEAMLNGKRLDDVNVFQLGDAQPIHGTVPSCDGTQAGLTLTPEAAAALGAPSFAGAFVGDACVVPNG